MGDDFDVARRSHLNDLVALAEFEASQRLNRELPSSTLRHSWAMAEFRASEASELAHHAARHPYANYGEQYASSLMRYYRGRGVAGSIAMRMRAELRSRAVARCFPQRGNSASSSSCSFQAQPGLLIGSLLRVGEIMSTRLSVVFGIPIQEDLLEYVGYPYPPYFRLMFTCGPFCFCAVKQKLEVWVADIQSQRSIASGHTMTWVEHFRNARFSPSSLCRFL